MRAQGRAATLAPVYMHCLKISTRGSLFSGRSLQPSTSRLRVFRAGQRVPSSADELIHRFWLLESESMEGQKASSDVSHPLSLLLIFPGYAVSPGSPVSVCSVTLLFCISYSCFSVAFVSGLLDLSLLLAFVSWSG